MASEFGEVDPSGMGAFARGAAMRDATRSWVLADERPDRSLGAALAWASQQQTDALHVLIDDDETAGQVARRAALFATPITVWRVDGRSLLEARPIDAVPDPPPSAQALELASLITEAGADVAIEHGVVTGEVLGLELARVVDDAQTGEVRLEVGVGKHDREAFAIVHGDVPTADALGAVIDAVRAHRYPGAAKHPLNQLAPERWLLVDLLAGRQPGLDGYRLQRASGTVKRASVKDVLPAIATGCDADGRPVVVAVSTGIDLDAIPLAADARETFDPTAALILVVPERDAHPVTRRLASALRAPATILTVPDTWREPVPA